MSLISTVVAIYPEATVGTPTFTDGLGWKIWGATKDRSVVFGSKGLTVGTSADNGATFTVRNTFGKTVDGATLNDNGELLVSLFQGGAPGEVWLSTGWTANPATATWAKVLQIPSGANGTQIRTDYSGISAPWGCGGIVVATEYGSHTNELGAGNAFFAAVRSYVSTDNGATFRQIFRLDQQMTAKGYDVDACPFHLHGGCYDPYWDRIWLTAGDGPFQAAGTQSIWYSDDWRNTTPTWTMVPNSDVTANPTQSGVYQSTSIVAMEKAILLGTDGVPAGIFRIPRRGYRVMGPIEAAHVIDGSTNSSISVIGHAFWRVDGSPETGAFIPLRQTGAQPFTRVVYTTDGCTFRDVAIDAAPPSATSFGGFASAFLTTAKHLVGTSTGNGRNAGSGGMTRYEIDLSAIV